MAEQQIAELLRKSRPFPPRQASAGFWMALLGLIVGCLLLGPETDGLLLGIGLAGAGVAAHQLWQRLHPLARRTAARLPFQGQ